MSAYRWEIDLSPGTRSVPCTRRAGVMVVAGTGGTAPILNLKSETRNLRVRRSHLQTQVSDVHACQESRHSSTPVALTIDRQMGWYSVAVHGAERSCRRTTRIHQRLRNGGLRP